MTNRIFKRVPVNIEAEIISYRVSCPAFIRNISEYGLHIKVANTEPVIFSKSDVDLQFRLPSGETLNLYCRKKWSYKNTSSSFIENMGVEIIAPPNEYKDFFRIMTRV